MTQLENLLNSLIKMGWKPWGKLVDKIVYIDSNFMLVCLNAIGRPIRQIKQDSLRELVSLESGLWQFVCENKLVKQTWKERALNPTYWPEWTDCDWSIQSNFKFRLLESALVPEEELGKFLVDNIIIEWLKFEQSKK